MKLLGIVGSITSPSKTRTTVETALDAAEGFDDIQTHVLHLAEYDLVYADGRRLEDYEGGTAEVLERVVEADAYIIGSPVYRASYSGVLKNLFDMIPRGRWQADVAPLSSAAVGLIATGATSHHYLALDEQLRTVMAFFGAHTLGSGVYAHDEHFSDGDLVDEDVVERLRTLGAGTVELARCIEGSDHLASLGPQI